MSGFAPPPLRAKNHVYSMTAVVSFQVEGFHRWPNAPERRAYLRDRHRHLFFVEVNLGVNHHDREVEYHDLLDFCRDAFPGGEMGSDSCEQMAIDLADKVNGQWPNRPLTVSVFEDNEVGAIVSRP